MRKTYLDNVRWITVALVVLYHVIFMFNGISYEGVIGPFSENQPQDVFMYIVYPWFMLLLFVVSGMSSRYYLEKHTDKEFVKTRTRKLLVPSTIGLLVGGWAMGYYNAAIGGGLSQMGEVPGIIYYFILCVSGTGVLWYIQVLWVFCIMLVLIRKIEKDKLYNLCVKANSIVILLLTFVVFGSAQILNVPVIVVYRFGIYGAGFFIGYFVLSHDEVMEKIEKQWILFCTMAVIFGIAFIVLYWGQNYAGHEVLDTFICNAYAWFGTIGVLTFMKKFGNFENDFSKFMNRNSWGLYVFHYFGIAVTAWYLHLYLPNLNPIVVYLLATIAGFAGGYIINAVVSRIPIIRWCLLGIKKEKK